jgi:hypothetical protein
MAKTTGTAKATTITAQLKQAIDESGLTVCRLAKETGVAQPILHRFVHTSLYEIPTALLHVDGVCRGPVFRN